MENNNLNNDQNNQEDIHINDTQGKNSSKKDLQENPVNSTNMIDVSENIDSSSEKIIPFSKNNTKDSDENMKNTTKNKNANKKENRTAKIVIGSVAAAIIVAASGFSIYVNGYESIMPNTYISDTNLGGMSQNQAISVLSDEFRQEKLDGQTMNFHCMGDSSSIDINNLSMEFEPEKMAIDAYNIGRDKPGFFNKLKNFTSSMFSENSIDPAIVYDEQALIGAINDLSAPHELEPLGYTFRIGDNSDIVIAKPQDGIKVDVNHAVKQITNQICLFDFSDVTFTPIRTEAPDIDLDAFYNYITKPAEDATYAKDESNRVYVVPGKPQIVINKSDIKAAIEQPLDDYSVPVQLVNPAVDSAFLQNILYEDTLGTYTTNYGGSSAARSNNIRLSSDTINGIELLPDEKFDFNKVVGQRTASRGYQQAPVFIVKDGKTETEMDYGGGICQVSSTLYCAVARAGLSVVARSSHSKDVTYVPEGMDATVSWGGPEFIFKNSTNYPIRIFISAGGGTLSVKIVGAKVSTPDISLDVQNDGSSIVVVKTTANSDGSTTQEIINSNTPPTPQPTEAELGIKETGEENYTQTQKNEDTDTEETENSGSAE